MRLHWMPNCRYRRSTNRDVRWRYSPASRGQGTLLIATRHNGLQVIAPPGVILASDAKSDHCFTYEGWRWACWPKDVNGEVWIDIERPLRSKVLALQEVVQLLPASRWSWVYERCRRYVLSLVGYITPSTTGTVPIDAEEALARLHSLLDEFKDVFPNGEWDRLVPPLSEDFEVPDSLSDEPQDAGRPDDRVALLSLSPVLQIDEHVTGT